jgi:DNA (cytosine-5)-methyltransferase 1
MRTIDLFAGLGGFTEGAEQAGCSVVWAANHWRAAVDIHGLNHPETSMACQDLQQADFTKVPAHDLLLASPACQGHSRARGADKPHHDALRSTAWAVVTDVEVHRPLAGVIENVPEFREWALFDVWCDALRRLGYSLAPQVIDAADHGVPQHRQRMFLVMTRSKAPLQLVLPQRAHVPAAAVVDFERGNWSPIHKPGRSLATLRRIEAGRKQFGHRFVMPYYSGGSGLTGRSLQRPIGTITTKNRWGVVDGDRMRMVTADETRAFMGFRSDYILPATTTESIFMLGNAVCPPVARDVIQALRAQV